MRPTPGGPASGRGVKTTTEMQEHTAYVRLTFRWSSKQPMQGRIAYVLELIYRFEVMNHEFFGRSRSSRQGHFSPSLSQNRT
jgi:hypothetical protein